MSNIDKFNSQHPPRPGLSRVGTEGLFSTQKSLDFDEINQLYNLNPRPNTAGAKKDGSGTVINFLKNVTRTATPNSVAPLTTVSETGNNPAFELQEKDKDEGLGEENSPPATTRATTIFRGPLASTTQDKALKNPEDKDDVLYLVTHENIEYLPLNIARNHVVVLVDEIKNLRTRHAQQLQILKNKLIGTAKYAKELQDRPKTPVEIPVDLSSRVEELNSEIQQLQITTKSKEKKLKLKIKELNKTLEIYKHKINSGEGLTEKELMAAKTVDVGDAVGEDGNELVQPSLTSIVSAESGDAEAELLKLLNAEKEKVKELQKQLEARSITAKSLDDTLMEEDGDADEEAAVEEQPTMKREKTIFDKVRSATSGATLSLGDQNKLKKIEKQLATEKKKFNREKTKADQLEKDYAELEKNLKKANFQISTLEKELKALDTAAVEGRDAILKAEKLEREMVDIRKNNAELEESFVKERKWHRF